VLSWFGKRRYFELLKELSGISPKGLADRLKELEWLGIIHKEKSNESSPHIEYL
jgi:DNA-binding HxlR family transcriptional regulator